MKLFIFIFICFMPFMVDAETKLTYEWKVDDYEYITSVDGKYYFYEDYDNSDYGSEYTFGYDGEIQIHTSRIMDEFELFMEYKDDFLQNLKDKVIKSYYLDAVKSVTVKANANTMKHLEY